MTPNEFLATLPAPLVLRGPGPYITDAMVAKRIRAELALATAAGLLPAKFSVRCSPGGHSRSIRLDVMEWHGGAIFSDARTAQILDGVESRSRRESEDRSETFHAAMLLVNQIANRHNYDESDRMTDYFCVGYYLSISADPVITAATWGLEQERDPKAAQLFVDAAAAALALGEKETKRILGRRKLETSGRFNLEWLISRAARLASRKVA